jgi:hypothetical protein
VADPALTKLLDYDPVFGSLATGKLPKSGSFRLRRESCLNRTLQTRVTKISNTDRNYIFTEEKKAFAEIS